MKKFIILLICLFVSNQVFSADWNNSLRTKFLNNQAVIYVINIRTFNAKDLNHNGVIDENEESGNFINAIERLDELQYLGINTVHLLPITPVGKIKAMGNAGSLYAISDFSSINPQLVSRKSNLSPTEQAKLFINECHKRNISVIVDLPSCGSYDLYLKSPELFKKDDEGNPIVPADWTDVRLFDSGDDKNINENLYLKYESFINLMLSLGVDGIRADVATNKPYKFWNELINYTRARNPEMLFLAEASDSWKTPVSKYAVFTPYDKLLEAGFDGYYGSYFNLKNWKTSKELISHVLYDQKLQQNMNKSVIGSFSTHDEQSPILINGRKFSKMIIWLNTTLPLNSYYVDGFPTGDSYTYPWANQKAVITYTDDDFYFIHKGQLDIFNFSRKPGGFDDSILFDFDLANKFKNQYSWLLSKSQFIPLKTSNSSVFAYARQKDNSCLVVVGNLDFASDKKVTVKVPKLNEKILGIPLKYSEHYPKSQKGKLTLNIAAGDILVILFNDFSI